jgi:hypothetical protein
MRTGKISLSTDGDLYSRFFNLQSLFTSCELIGQFSGSGSGGLNFNCYEEGEYITSMPFAGTGFSEVFTGTSSIRMPFQEDFEIYPTGSLLDQTSSVWGFDIIYVGNVTGSV